MKTKLGIMASGRGSNMRSLVEACQNNELDAEVTILISNNADSPALSFAKDQGINTAHMSSITHPNPAELDQAMLNKLKEARVELVILAGFMKKIGQHTLAAYQGRIINVHPSLLPKYGGQGMFGMRVHQAVIDNHETETGVTIHLVDGEYDQGAVLAQEIVKVEQNDDAATLAARVLAVEHRLYKETIQKILEDSIILP